MGADNRFTLSVVCVAASQVAEVVIAHPEGQFIQAARNLQDLSEEVTDPTHA
jgi:hypothetical protein